LLHMIHATSRIARVSRKALMPYAPSSIMGLDFLPPHLIILGGSYIGLEFAQMFRRFGSEVTVIEVAPRLIAREDEDVSAAVAGFLREEGINLLVDTKVLKAERQGNYIAFEVTSSGTTSRVVGTHVLAAIGRQPNTDDLALDNAGIATDARGYIEVDDELRTNVPGIWAMGDCNGRGAFTHTSYNDFEIVAANVLDNGQRRVGDRIPAYALYTDPPLGRVGLTETEVRRTGRPALMATMPMEDVSRAYEKGETTGFMKILVAQDNAQILGASFLGLAGDEVVHCLLDLMYAKAPYTVVRRAMHIHPTVSEFIPTMMGELKPLQ
jgi:pyruvate/2-oxoglutarate dehydrogenase complex dihydrolipoamide dehydrogenase (E3) component